jgi:hypothetical protein
VEEDLFRYQEGNAVAALFLPGDSFRNRPDSYLHVILTRNRELNFGCTSQGYFILERTAAELNSGIPISELIFNKSSKLGPKGIAPLISPSSCPSYHGESN